MANLVYNRGKYVAAGFPLAATSEVLTLMLVSTGYTANQDHNLVDDGTTDDPKSYEIAVSGYARANLASKVRFEDDTNDFAGLDAADVTYSALAAGATVGGDITIQWASTSAGGVLKYGTTS